MSSFADDSPVMRIVVALDARYALPASLDVAARLAAELHAELLALLVEDVNLARLTELPGAFEIGLSSGIRRPLDAQTLQRAVQASADALRRSLERHEREHNLRWSLRTVRSTMYRACAESPEVAVDLLLLAGSAARAEGPRRPPATGVVPPVSPPCLLVIIDESSGWRRVLATAERLATRTGAAVQLLVLSDDLAKARHLAMQAEQYLREHHLSQFGETTRITHYRDVVNVARHRKAQIALLHIDSPLLDESTLEQFIHQLDCPLGIVRPQAT